MPAQVLVDLGDDDDDDESVSAVEEELKSMEITMNELRARRNVLRCKLASLRSFELQSTSPPSSLELGDSGYPWDAELRAAARVGNGGIPNVLIALTIDEPLRVFNVRDRYLGVTDSRENQLSILNALMSGADAVMVAPTGSGKSLVYQLPAIITGTQAATAADKKMTVVVSP
ncbi:hypothetical protein FOZ62_024325, partial [Perkinsus olseni]